MTLALDPLISAANTTLHPLNELDSNLLPNFSAAGQVLKVLDDLREFLADYMYQQGFNAGMELAEILAEEFNQDVEKGMQDIQERLQSLGTPIE